MDSWIPALTHLRNYLDKLMEYFVICDILRTVVLYPVTAWSLPPVRRSAARTKLGCFGSVRTMSGNLIAH